MMKKLLGGMCLSALFCFILVTFFYIDILLVNSLSMTFRIILYSKRILCFQSQSYVLQWLEKQSWKARLLFLIAPLLFINFRRIHRIRSWNGLTRMESLKISLQRLTAIHSRKYKLIFIHLTTITNSIA